VIWNAAGSAGGSIAVATASVRRTRPESRISTGRWSVRAVGSCGLHSSRSLMPSGVTISKQTGGVRCCVSRATRRFRPGLTRARSNHSRQGLSGDLVCSKHSFADSAHGRVFSPKTEPSRVHQFVCKSMGIKPTCIKKIHTTTKGAADGTYWVCARLHRGSGPHHAT